MATSHSADLSSVAEQALQELSAKHEARERGLQISREVIRLSANAIRAVHRQEFHEARELIGKADARLRESSDNLKEWPEDLLRGLSVRRQKGV